MIAQGQAKAINIAKLLLQRHVHFGWNGVHLS